MLTWWEGLIEYGHGVGEYVIADSAYRTVRRVQAARGLHGDLHEFVITPRNTALLTSYVITGADLTSVGGPRKGTIQDAIFQEIDLASGKVLLEWHSLDRIPLEESYAPVEAENWDFFHINSVDLDGDGNLLVSSRSTHTVYKLDRSGSDPLASGRQAQRLRDGPGQQLRLAARCPPPTGRNADDLRQRSTPAVEKLSRGLILDIDEQAMTATLLRQYTHPKILTGSQGNMQLLENGNVFIGWGEVPRVSEFDRSGRLVFDAVLGEKYQSYRAFRLPWSGRAGGSPGDRCQPRGPRGDDRLCQLERGDRRSHWQLLAGARPGALTPVSSTTARGFESALHSVSAGPYFAVRALDASGSALGQSSTVSVA